MKKRILIDANFPTETRVVLLDKNNNIEDVEYHSAHKKQTKGNVYLAKVTRVEPSLQAAFVDYGDDNKGGFLPFNEIHPDYYHVPSNDRKDSTPSWNELTSPEITSDDLAEKSQANKFSDFADADEIDIDAIQQMVDNKTPSDFDIEADEMEKDVEKSWHPKDYKIQEVIKKGQIILVQVTKEERGNKGASLTSFISLAGKYCVLMPNKPLQNGISKKISNANERKRLKSIIDSLNSGKSRETSSVIARTAGIGHTSLEIKRDYDYLVRLWNKIREATLKAQAPCFIHQEDGVLLKTIRDIFDHQVKEIVVQGMEAYNNCIKFMRDILPNEVGAVKEYKGKTPIFTKFGVEDQLTKLYQPNVHLPSGGYIVINPTEALVSIDVNSGKATGQRNIEEMALRTNLEAAREIARQAKLRDLSGLLVLDFIDMSESKNRKIVERSLKEFLSRDKARVQTGQISSFGLLEMSRQRLRPSFLEINSSMCSHCSGKGLVRADDSNAMLILRTIENEIYNSQYDNVNVYGAEGPMLYLLNNKREEIAFVEKKYGIRLNFHVDQAATSDSYAIEKVKLADKNKMNLQNHAEPALQDTSEIYNQDFEPRKRKILMNENALEDFDKDPQTEEAKALEKKKNNNRSRRKKQNQNLNGALPKEQVLAESSTAAPAPMVTLPPAIEENDSSEKTPPAGLSRTRKRIAKK